MDRNDASPVASAPVSAGGLAAVGLIGQYPNGDRRPKPTRSCQRGLYRSGHGGFCPSCISDRSERGLTRLCRSNHAGISSAFPQRVGSIHGGGREVARDQTHWCFLAPSREQQSMSTGRCVDDSRVCTKPSHRSKENSLFSCGDGCHWRDSYRRMCLVIQSRQVPVWPHTTMYNRSGSC